MKIGDVVRVISVPGSLASISAEETKRLFALCVGQEFPIEGFENGLIELHVGGALGEPSYMHSIWIEHDCVEPILARD